MALSGRDKTQVNFETYFGIYAIKLHHNIFMPDKKITNNWISDVFSSINQSRTRSVDGLGKVRLLFNLRCEISPLLFTRVSFAWRHFPWLIDWQNRSRARTIDPIIFSRHHRDETRGIPGVRLSDVAPRGRRWRTGLVCGIVFTCRGNR